MTNWISVEKRLPRDYADVIMLTHMSDIFMGFYSSTQQKWQPYNNKEFDIYEVTHWIPLPPLP